MLPEVIPNTPTKDQIMRLQHEMSLMPQAELETDHFFANGMYARKLERTAGTLIVGKVHKHEHLFIIAKGKLAIWTEDGMRELGAGSVIVSKPNTKRVTLALEDSIGITVHRTELTDVSEIEEEIIEPDPESMFDALNRIKFKELTL